MTGVSAFRMIEAWSSPESCYFKYSRVDKPLCQKVLRLTVPWALGLLALHMCVRLLNILLTSSSKLRLLSPSRLGLLSPYLLREAWWYQETVQNLQHWTLLGLCAALALHCLALMIVANTVEEETVLAVRSMGLQLSRSYCSGREQNLFIDVGRLKDILVNEAFSGHRVVSRLLVEGSCLGNGVKSAIHVPFCAANPRIHEVVYCWRFLRSVLFLETDSNVSVSGEPISPRSPK
eukprot:Gregarina_sp_Poly_1__6881@NODE_372_length_9144_cov_60_017517_g307_i0_p3_GENE_NODE_372_length_9144_cov_60_017517_g307_i0NODE_372_length_9144_cov_60_017517_g307_i0_p3_ORF_typecomplete_len234_score24_94PIGH/PF10181_9/7_3e12PIGH/PF10181_9/2_4e03_NODE_372_length_9144_cov_60_017517_g307_i012361937